MAQLYSRHATQKSALTSVAHFFLGSMLGLDWRLRLGANAFELEGCLVHITRYICGTTSSRRRSLTLTDRT